MYIIFKRTFKSILVSLKNLDRKLEQKLLDLEMVNAAST